jgi:hypothetical protein
MAKRSHHEVKFSKAEMDLDLPVEIDFRKMGLVVRGPAAVKKVLERSRRTVGLDPDVAKVFGDSESVNNVLRAIIANLPPTGTARQVR